VTIPYHAGGSYAAEASTSTDEQAQILPALLIWLGTNAISATTCGAGWMIARRVMISDCERQGHGFSSISVGACGVGPASTIECDIEKDTGENGALISWNNFAQHNLPWSFQIQNHVLNLSIPSAY